MNAGNVNLATPHDVFV